MKNTDTNEWSRYYRLDKSGSVEALHARFVSHRYPRHAHDYFVVGLVDSGAQSYWYRGARHITPAGQIFLVNPDEPHTGEAAAPEGYIYRTMYPHADYLARITEDVGHRASLPFFKGAVICDPPLATRLANFHQSLATAAPKVESESFLLEALARLIARHSDSRVMARPIGRERPAVRTAREYMEANFHEDVTLSKLAAIVSLSPYHFARAFEKETGLPPHAYLEGVRIRKVRELLDRNETLVAAALAAGYSDQSHLTRRFKRFLGITPGQYVREGKIRQDTRHDSAIG